jgi:tetratricopeptide (TPR) repeat protein
MAILAVYWQVGNHEFVSLDDGKYITENPMVRAGVTLEGARWAFGFSDIAYWHPMTWLSHMVDCQLFGLNSGMHHMINVIFHIANSLLLFLIFKRMTGAVWQCAFVAALFAVHPVNVESVAWAAERKNLICTFFGMLALMSYSYYAEKPFRYSYLITLIFFALSLMSKPALVTLPAVMLLLDYWPLRRFRLKAFFHQQTDTKKRAFGTRILESKILSLIAEKIPFVMLSAASVYLSFLSTHLRGIVVTINETPMGMRIAHAFISYLIYLGKIVWPLKLAFFYPYPKSIPIGLMMCAIIWLICVTGIFIRFSLRLPALIFGWLWYLGTLLPHLGLLQVGLWPAVADRWAYVPSIGLFVIAAWGIPGVWSNLKSRFQWRRALLVASAGLLLLGLMILSWIQVGYWRSNFTIYSHAIDVTEENDVAHNNLGAAYLKHGNPVKAIFHFVEALRIMPGYAAAHDNLIKSLAHYKKNKDAITEMKKLIEIYPSLPALKYSLGNLYRNKGELDKSIICYRQALSSKPDFTQAINNLASVYVIQKDYERALPLLKKIITIDRDAADVYYVIAIIYSEQKQIENATNYLKMAVEMGFEDWKSLRTDPRLKNLRATFYYENLLKKH